MRKILYQTFIGLLLRIIISECENYQIMFVQNIAYKLAQKHNLILLLSYVIVAEYR